MFSRIPFQRVNWLISSFLIGTLFLALTAVPVYIWFFGIDGFQIALFLFMFFACGFSVTLGYHRLYSHLTFQAHWVVRLCTLIFGAGAFENSVLLWACEHRTHHKHVDHDEDPYNVTKGLFHAHMGWLMFKLDPLPPFDNVADLQRDPLVMWQHRYIHWIAATVAFVFPAILGFAWGGWVSALGAFLIAGVARVVILQHCTFCINSLCHYLGTRPYSSRRTARDSWLMAIVTLGEGYHNYHHEFQHDYRNGVKPWQIDPTSGSSGPSQSSVSSASFDVSLRKRFSFQNLSKRSAGSSGSSAAPASPTPRPLTWRVLTTASRTLPSVGRSGRLNSSK